MTDLASCVVRCARPADAGWIAALHAESWRESYRDHLPAGMLGRALDADRADLWARIFARDVPGRLILAVSDLAQGGAPLGFLITTPAAEQPGWDMIRALHVVAAERGRGLGALLMREAADRLGAMGRARAFLDVLEANTAGRRFYTRLGGREAERVPEELVPGVSAPAVVIRWDRLADLALAARADLARRAAPPLALTAAEVPGVAGAPHPVPEADVARGRIKRALGNAFGLSQFGVNRLDLPPGVASSLLHRHSHEDEFVHVLAGEVWLVTPEGERRLGPGDCAGFAAGGRLHRVENRGDAPATLLEIGSRLMDRDEVVYPEAGLRIAVEPDGSRVYRDASGSVLGPAD